MRPALVALPFVLASTSLLAGTTWDPIPPELWTRKETPQAEAAGASLVKATYHFTDQYFEYKVRIRITSERGKAAASWGNLPTDTWNLAGRTVLPDGKEIAFKPDRDIHRVTNILSAKGEDETQTVVPPGLTGNCLVDFTYITPRWLPIRQFGCYARWNLAGAYPVETLVVDMPKDAPFLVKVVPGTKEKDGSFQQIETKSSRMSILKDIPVRQEVPFTLDSTLDSPTVTVSYSKITYIHGDTTGLSFWLTFARETLYELRNSYLHGPEKGYLAFSEAIRKDLPRPPLELAFELGLRLNARIRNTSAPTFQELTDQSRRKADLNIQPTDVETAIRRGATSGVGMGVLYFRLLVDAGILPKVAFVTNRNESVFHPADRNPGQFQTVLFGIEEPGHPTLWVDPSLRFAPPGLLRPQFQGSPALVVDLGATPPEKALWPQVLTLPLSDPLACIRNDTYHLECLEDEDRLTLESRFTGVAEYEERSQYCAFAPSGQDHLLQESLGTAFKDFRVDSARVENAADPSHRIRLAVAGRFERPASPVRSVVPFPLTPCPLAIPRILPSARKEIIVLPQALTQASECTILVPEGFHWKATAPVLHSNLFGDVAYKAENSQENGKSVVKATRVVKITTPMAEAAAWPELLTFLGWLQEAQDWTLALDPTPPEGTAPPGSPQAKK